MWLPIVLKYTIINIIIRSLISIIISINNTVDPVYSERVGAAKSVHLRRVFITNVFNLTTN
jgi:hypothetical protein